LTYSIEFFVQLAKNKVRTKTQVVAVLIVSEENTEIPGVGVEDLMKTGKLEFIKNGPVIWVDCSDSQPCIGTAGVVTWTLKAIGKLFHSGLPHLGINALELGMDAIAKIQERFYKDFGPLEQEREYNFACPSTMKPTRVCLFSSSCNIKFCLIFCFFVLID
jgi:acetylornithine deacetylase